MSHVTIILANIDEMHLNPEEILSQIAPCYAEKYRRFKMEREAKQELVCGYLLLKYLGVSKDEQIAYTKHHKPYLVSKTSHFNLSHSGKYVVLAIADCEVGVDVEQIRICHEPTVRKVFSTALKEQIQCMDQEQKNAHFTQIWTEYEAMLKLKGTGFAKDWDHERSPEDFCSLSTILRDNYFVTCATMDPAIIEIIDIIENPASH